MSFSVGGISFAPAPEAATPTSGGAGRSWDQVGSWSGVKQNALDSAFRVAEKDAVVPVIASEGKTGGDEDFNGAAWINPTVTW